MAVPVFLTPCYNVLEPKATALVYGSFSRNNISPSIRTGERANKEKNYYELLGVSVEASMQEIKEVHRKLQKKHHPDIAGQQDHEYTLMLNEAYKVQMREDLRKDYDGSICQMRVHFGKNIPIDANKKYILNCTKEIESERLGKRQMKF